MGFIDQPRRYKWEWKIRSKSGVRVSISVASRSFEPHTARWPLGRGAGWYGRGVTAHMPRQGAGEEAFSDLAGVKSLSVSSPFSNFKLWAKNRLSWNRNYTLSNRLACQVVRHKSVWCVNFLVWILVGLIITWLWSQILPGKPRRIHTLVSFAANEKEVPPSLHCQVQRQQCKLHQLCSDVTVDGDATAETDSLEISLKLAH